MLLLMQVLAALLVARPAHALIPLSVYEKLSRINSTGDFLTTLVHPAGNDAAEQTDEGRAIERLVFQNSEVASVSEVSIAYMDLPPSDECSPRNVTMQVPTPSVPNVVYWPTCTKLEQCGGCCGHERLECAPTRTETVSVNFLKAQYNHDEAGFHIMGMETLVFERHLACVARCRVQPQHCNPQIQKYNAGACRCECKNQVDAIHCSPAHIWEDKICACMCRRREPCWDHELFDELTCKCVQKPVTQLETTTTTPAATTTVRADPCIGVGPCRTGYTPVREGDSCRCKLSSIEGIPDPFSLPGRQTGTGRPTHYGPTYPNVPNVPNGRRPGGARPRYPQPSVPNRIPRGGNRQQQVLNKK